MKKTLLVGIVLAVLLSLTPVTAQTIPGLAEFNDGFKSFSETFASSLPMNSTIGLNWSDAYIGQLLPIPSFGVGVTTGVTMVPVAAFNSLLDDLDLGAANGFNNLPGAGVPLPGYAIDARIGGLIIPFDVGIKFGTMPKLDLGDVSAEYTNFGVDFRYAILAGGVVLPKVSVGVGYNRLSGRLRTPLGIGTTTLASVEVPDDDTYTLSLADPRLDFGWEANVFDFKAQVSKGLLIIEPHFGIGASFGNASTDAGLSTTVTATNSSGDDVSVDDDIGSVAGVDISGTGVSIGTDVSTFSVRVFGGTSLNLPFLRFDFGAMYNINSRAWGGTIGARVQL